MRATVTCVFLMLGCNGGVLELKEEQDEPDLPDTVTDPEQPADEASDPEDADPYESAEEDVCSIGLEGGGFYGELIDEATGEYIAWLWTEDNCTITVTGFSYDLSGTIDPTMHFSYGDDLRSWATLEAREYANEDFVLEPHAYDDVPPIGPHMGMDVKVYDTEQPVLFALTAFLWAP